MKEMLKGKLEIIEFFKNILQKNGKLHLIMKLN